MDFTSHYKSPLGNITIASDGDFLIGLWFEGQQHFADALADNSRAQAGRTAGQQYFTGDLNATSHELARRAELPVFAETKRWLDIYFSGKEPSFTPPLHMRTTPFRKEVWEIMLSIPYGQTMTYGDIAAILAKKRGLSHISAQAVGGAVGHNAISLIIPCHRVIGANGHLTGYAAGLARKAWLLDFEKGL